MQRVLCFVALLASPTASGAERIWTGPDVNLLGAPSRDGRYLTYVDRGDLAMRDLRSGSSVRLTSRPPGSKEFAYFSTPSLDGARAAYAWFNAAGFYELRMARRNGASDPLVLYRNEDAAFVQPCAWSADGEHILTLLFRRDNISQIVLIPSSGGPPKFLRSLNWVYPKRMDLSPDGKFLVYDSFAGEGSDERAVFVLATDGSTEIRLTRRTGSFAFPLWTHDGAGIVYAQQPAPGPDLWFQPMHNGEPQGEPKALGTFGRTVPLGIADGHLFFGQRTGGTDVFLAELADPVKSARRVTLRFAGLNRAPAFSPDGGRMAYLSRRGSENFGEAAYAVVVRSLEGDEEREVETQLAHVAKVRWASNGAILLVGSDSRGRSGVYTVSLTGERSIVTEEAGADYRTFDGVRAGQDVVVRSGSEIRCGAEVLFRGRDLRALAASPDGEFLAIAEGTNLVLLNRRDRTVRKLPLPGITEMDWQHELVVAANGKLLRVSISDGTPRLLESPGNLLPGFALHPDGKRIALSAGGESAEVWRMKLP